MWKALLKLFCPPHLNNIDYESFHLAIETGDMPLIEEFINTGADIEARTNDQRGFTSLGVAIAHGQVPVIDFLLTKNPNIFAKDKKGNTLLALAAYSNQTARVEYFLDQGIGIECKGFRDNTPLLVASWRGNIDVVRLLVSRGANIHETNKFGDTALILAAKANRLEVVKYLVERGVSLETKGEKGNTALIAASKEGNTEVVEFLTRSGANVAAINDDGDTALSLAQKYQHGDSCAVLGAPGKITLHKRLENIGYDEGKVPEELLCPISIEIMDEPVTLSNGQTFDRKSLTRWFLTNESEFSCPLTRDPIKSEELTFKTNILIKNMCEKFVESLEKEAGKNKHPAEEDQSNDSENIIELPYAPAELHSSGKVPKVPSAENFYRLFSSLHVETQPDNNNDIDFEGSCSESAPLLDSCTT